METLSKEILLYAISIVQTITSRSEAEDDEYVDEATGEILEGSQQDMVRLRNISPDPIVQMGLFMDGNGIPISMCLYPGSDNEQKCAVPLEEKITKMFKNKQFIYCADAGLGSLSIRQV